MFLQLCHMDGDKHFPSAELMTDEGVFELSVNESVALFAAEVHNTPV